MKASGGKGLHLVVPLAPSHTYDLDRTFARSVAERLARERPADITDRRSRADRPGRVLIDWGEIDPNRSIAGAYSLRAARRPGGSAPVSWEEVATVAEGGDPEALRFQPEEILSPPGAS